MGITKPGNQTVWKSLLMGLTFITFSSQPIKALAATIKFTGFTTPTSPADGSVFFTTRLGPPPVTLSGNGIFTAEITPDSGELVGYELGARLLLNGTVVKEMRDITDAVSFPEITMIAPLSIPLNEDIMPLLGRNDVKYEIGILDAVVVPNGSSSPTRLPPMVASSQSSFLLLVPEPLTLLGSGLAIGFGAWLQRDFSKKRKKIN